MATPPMTSAPDLSELAAPWPCSNVDTDTIKLIGRWQSDAMLRYLHLQAQPVMSGFSRKMLVAGDYRFHAADTLVPLY